MNPRRRVPRECCRERLASLKTFLAHVRERLGLDVGFALWDGSTVPADGCWRSAWRTRCHRRLLRRPNGETLANLWVTARIAYATERCLMGRWSQGAHAGVPQDVDKRTCPHPVEVPVRVARRPWPLETPPTSGRATAPRRRTRRTSPITTTCPMRSTRSGSTARWFTPAATLPAGTTTSTGCSRTSSR